MKTQNQALSALLFLYKEVLEIELPYLDKLTRVKNQRMCPLCLPLKKLHQLFSRFNRRIP